jgi:hypothetical protein
MHSSNLLYARTLVTDPTSFAENACTIPLGTHLNKTGQADLALLREREEWKMGVISHYTLLPVKHASKFNGNPNVRPDDLCVFGGTIAQGMYVSSGARVTSPVVLCREKRVLTSSRSIYMLGKECSVEELIMLFPQLHGELNPSYILFSRETD